MHKKRIIKGQSGLPINYNLGLSPSTQRGLQEILYGSSKLNYTAWDPAKTSIKNIDLGYKGLNASSPLANMGKADKGKSLGGLSKAGAAVEVISGLIPKYDNESELTNKANTAYDTAASTLTALPSATAQIAGYSMKALGALDDTINNLTGGAITINDPLSKADALTSSKFKYMIPGMTAYSAINSLTKTKVDDSDKYLTKGVIGYSTDTAEGGEVGGITDKISGMFNTAKKSIAENGLFGSIKKNVKEKGVWGSIKSFWKKSDKNSISTKRENRVNLVDYQNLQKKRESNKAAGSAELGQSNFRDVLSKNQQQLQGINPLLYAKNGTSFNEIKKIKREVLKKLEAQKFKDGGKVNVIPEGKLHSRLNEHNEKEITRKGIPVVVYKDGKAIQHAEIEKEELIINFDLTNKIEDLRKKFKDTGDEKYLIEAGKLFSEDILENTEDNVNLIDKN